MSYANKMSSVLTQAELAHQLRTSVMRLARRLRRERFETSLSFTQLATLGTLDRHGPLTPRELADHERVQPPSMTRVLGHLEELGLVTRAPHPTDGRQVLVALTDAARDLLQADRKQREAWLAKQMSSLDREERETLRRASLILDRLAQA